MTLGIALPAFLAFSALIEVPLFLKWRSKATTGERAANLIILVSIALPFIAYAVLNLFVPDIGAIEVF